MSITRLTGSTFPAFTVTFTLLLCMQLLIKTNFLEPNESHSITLPDISMPKTTITDTKSARPQKPPQVEEPPQLPRNQLQTVSPSHAMLTVAPDIDTNTSSGHQFYGDHDLIITVKPAPNYPAIAIRNNIEGSCTVAYTVTAEGSTRDIHALQCDHASFIKPSVEAAKNFRYLPRTVDGIAQEVIVKNKFTFTLGKN